MIAIGTAAKLFGGGLIAAVVIGVAGYFGGRGLLKTYAHNEAIAALDSGRKHDDSVRVAHDAGYRVDTVRLRTVTSAYRPLAAAARKTPRDTAAVLKALTACDSAIAQAAVVITACQQRVADRDAIIANRDSLVRELRKPLLEPRFSYDLAGMYDVFTRANILRAGGEYRTWFDFRARVEGEYSDKNGLGLRVGIRKQF